MFKELFWVEIWCTIATHMGFKIAAFGCVAPAHLQTSNFKRSYLSCPNSDSHVLGHYGKLFESRILSYSGGWNLVLKYVLKI